jgi:uncharacterized protein YdaU (DUF1376 family)
LAARAAEARGMSATPFMPLWVGDFLTKTISLDTRETGAYMLLLMAMWTNGGTLPEDHKKLQRIARAGRDWPTIWQGIAHFFTVADGVISNKRLTEELHKAQRKSLVNSQSGARGGKAKALKEKNAALANATISPKQSYSEPERVEANASTYTPTPAPKPKRKVPDDPPGFAEFWAIYPCKKSKDDARKAWVKALLGADQETIMAAARRVEDRGEYTPYAATWLNKKRWQDEVTSHEPDRPQQPRRPGGGQALLDAAARASARFRSPSDDQGGEGGTGGGGPSMDFGPRGGATLTLLAFG